MFTLHEQKHPGIVLKKCHIPQLHLTILTTSSSSCEMANSMTDQQTGKIFDLIYIKLILFQQNGIKIIQNIEIHQNLRS